MTNLVDAGTDSGDDHIDLRSHGYITTFTGARFYYDHPGPFVMGDISHSLSLITRFCGHTRFFYSVAQHSIMVSEMMKQDGLSPEEQAAGLLHDAHEAYVGDVPTPMKWACPELVALERSIAAALRAAMLPAVHEAIYKNLVKPYDDVVLHKEAAELLRPVPKWVRAAAGWGYSGLSVRFRNPLYVEQEFHMRAKVLGLA